MRYTRSKPKEDKIKELYELIEKLTAKINYLEESIIELSENSE